MTDNLTVLPNKCNWMSILL